MSTDLTTLHAQLAAVPEGSTAASEIIDQICTVGAAASQRKDDLVEIIDGMVAVRLPKPELRLPDPAPIRYEFTKFSAAQVRQALAGGRREGVPYAQIVSSLVSLEQALVTGGGRVFPGDAQGQKDRDAYRQSQMLTYEALHGAQDREPTDTVEYRAGAGTRKTQADDFWNALGMGQTINAAGLGNDTAVWDVGVNAWAMRGPVGEG
jgi:hypothetical protein